MISQSTITCPKCGHQAVETMPADACVIAYVCRGCGEALRPLAGDCWRVLLLRFDAVSFDSGTPPRLRLAPVRFCHAFRAP